MSLTLSRHVQHAEGGRATDNLLSNDGKAVNIACEGSLPSQTAVSQQLGSRPQKIFIGKQKIIKLMVNNLKRGIYLLIYFNIIEFGGFTHPLVFLHLCLHLEQSKFH